MKGEWMLVCQIRCVFLPAWLGTRKWSQASGDVRGALGPPLPHHALLCWLALAFCLPRHQQVILVISLMLVFLILILFLSPNPAF